MTPSYNTKRTMRIPVEVSARHVHLTAQAVAKLFGASYRLKPVRSLSQRGEFASSATLTIRTKAGEIAGVRVLGPTRLYSQVELAASDAYRLGLKPPVRRSGKHSGTPGITLVGPRGTVKLQHGVILQRRHIHLSPQQAQRYHLRDGQRVSVRISGERSIVFEQVEIKVQLHFVGRLHLDTDEGNAAGVRKGTRGVVIP